MNSGPDTAQTELPESQSSTGQADEAAELEQTIAAAESLAVAGTVAASAASAAVAATSTAAAAAAADQHQQRPQSQADTAVEQAGDALLLQAAGKLSIEELSRNTFQAISDYVKGELEITIDDYALLVEMNRVATQKYADMHNVASGVSKSLEDLNEKYRALQPYLDQVDHLEASVTQLEQAAYRLDAYSKRLEAKFKSLEKR